MPTTVAQGSIDIRVFKAMPGNSIVLLPDAPLYTIVAATEAFQQTSGRTEEELIGRGMFEAFPGPPEDPDHTGVQQLHTSLHNVILQKAPDQMPLVRYDIENGDGTFDERYWTAVNKPVLGADGSVQYIIHTAEEKTLQVTAERSAHRIESLEKSHDLFLQAPVAIGLATGPDYVVEVANDSLLEVWDRSSADVLGKPLFEGVPDLDGQGYRELLDEVCASGEPFYGYEHPVRLKRNGREELLYFDFVYKPYYEEGSTKPAGVFTVGHNVTKQVESRHKFRSVIEEAQDPILILMGEDLVLDTANGALFSLWQVGPEALGKPLLDILPGIKDQGIVDLLQKVLHTGEPFYGREVPAMIEGSTEAGKTKYFDFSYQPYRNAEGHIAGVLVMARDISSQVEARKKIEESEGRFRLMADTVPAIIWMTEPDGVCTYLNKRWYDLTGQREEEALGFGWLNAVHPDDSECSGKTFIEANANREAFHLVYRLRQKDGTYRWAIDSGEPRFNEDGSFAGYIGSVIDVHEQKMLEENMRRSEERYRHLFQNSPVAKWDEDFTAVKKRIDQLAGTGVTDFPTYFNQHTDELLGLINSVAIRDVNEAALRMWGGTKEELLNGLQQFFIDDTLQTFIEELAVIGAGGGRYETETTVQNKDGQKVNVLVRIDFPRGADYSSVPVILINITDRKKSEEALRESESRFRTLAEALPQMVWMRNSNGLIEFGSRYWEEYSGIAGVTDAWKAMVHPDDWKSVMDAWERDSAKGQAYRYEVRLKNKEGDYRWHYASGEPIRDGEGNVIKWIGALTDIHAQKTFAENLEREVAQRTRDLQHSESFLQQLIDSSVEFISVVDRNLRFVTVNKSVEQRMHKTRNELKDAYLFDFHPDLKHTEGHAAILKALEGETVHLDKRHSIAQPDRYTDSYFIPYLAEGAVVGVIIMARDITAMVQTEKMLELAVKELERSNEDLQQFAHVASHDLKEPVRKVKTFASRLEQHLEGKLDETAARFIERIHSATNRMFTMIDGVLSYSTVNAAAEPAQPVNMAELIKNIEADLEVTIQKTGTQLGYGGLPTIEGAPVLLYQVFYNLINNSIKFARQGVAPRISITAEALDGEKGPIARIILSDNGIGFEDKQAAAIFDTFTRLHSKDQYEGTGLGLALCKKVVERHGGSISAKGRPGEGATFTLLLPLQQMKKSI